MGEAKAVSDSCLSPANHQNCSRFTPLITNHVEDSEHPPLHIPHWFAPSLPGRCWLLQSQLTREAPPTFPPPVSQPEAPLARGLARFPTGYLRAGIWEGGWKRPQASCPPDPLRSELSLRPPSCPFMWPHPVRNKRGRFWLWALPSVWPPLPWDPLAGPPVQTLLLAQR